MDNKTKQRWLWIGGILLAVWYFGLPAINSYRQQEAYRRAIAARQAAAAEKAAKQTSPLPASGASAGGSASLDTLTGVYQGAAVLPQGMCGLKLELRKKPGDADHFAGYPVLGCMPIPGNPTGQPGTEAQRLIASANPISAVLTGTVQNGSIQFIVDKVIGQSVAGCSLTGMTVTPFGGDQIAVEWQEGTCAGGHLLSKRIGK